jgi:tetratricopeptide (TPR) repeat protein
VILIAMVTTNLDYIRADIVFKQGEAMRNAGQWDIAIDHYKYASSLNPDEDFYDLWLGAAYLEKATNAPATASILTGNPGLDSMLGLDFVKTYQLNRQDTLTVAQAILEHARDLNPLNTDHTANLARLHRRWADLYTDNPTARQQELETAGNYYTQATILSPHNAQLWNEWATVLISMSDLAKQNNDTAKSDSLLADAQAKLDQSLQLDQQFDQTYLIRAQLARAQGKNDEAEQLLAQALKQNPGNSDAWASNTDMLLQQGNYTEAERVTTSFLQANPNSLPAMRTLARNIYYPQNRLSEAIAMQEQVVQLGASDPNRWDDQRVLAYFLAQTGQTQQALDAAQQALNNAPQDKRADIQALIDQLKAQLSGVTPQPQGLPTPAPTPAP